jgi:hypothetical protein
MYKILGADGREYGPVTAEILKQWIAQGRANGETKVLAEGASDWKSLREFPELAAALPSAAPPPVFGLPPVGGSPLPADVGTRDYDLDIGGCFQRGWQLLTGPKMWLVIGGVAIWLLIQMGMQGLAQIPFIGLVFVLVNLVLTAPLMGGVFFFVLRCLRGEAAQVDDIFAGFKHRFGNLFLAYLVMVLLMIAVAIPGGLFIGGGALAIATEKDAAIVLGIGLIALGALLILLPLIYLGVSWAFAFALIADKRLDFWPAIQLSRRVVGRHFFFVLILLFATAIIQSLGVCFCCVGMFFTVPLALAIKMSAYERMFTLPTEAVQPRAYF